MYKRTIWKDHVPGVQEGTSMNAEKFNKIEAGTMEANALAAINAEYQRHANDIAKNNEIVTISFEFPYADDGECKAQEYYVAIPENATRNNTTYNVVTEIASLNDSTTSLILITKKQVNGFTAELRENMSYLIVRFHIFGGMI